MILSDSERGEMLLKDSKKVYILKESDVTLTEIPHLSASSTVYQESSDSYSNHFLFDDNTFYLTDSRFYEMKDITYNFQLFGKSNNFSNSEFTINNGVSLDTKDNNLWLYVRGGFDLDESRIYFYPSKAKFLNSYKYLLIIKR